MNISNLKHFLFLFTAVNILSSCGAKKEFYNIECINLENEGFVNLKISNLRLKTDYNIENASKDAIKAILYSGYSSTNCPTQKPFLKETEDLDNFKKIEKSFFSKNGIWKSFVRNSADSNNIKPTNNIYFITTNRLN